MSAPAARRLRVCVVEDHPFQRFTLVNVLGELGIADVAEAANGNEALDMLQHRGAPLADVVLCDLDMPHMDGIEFLRLAARRRLMRSVIIVSACEPQVINATEGMLHAYGMHVLGRLAKPVTLAKLRELPWDSLNVAPAAQATPPAAVAAAELRRALGAGEFGCAFQPKVNLATGRLTGVEALARWRPGGAGAVPPAVFVPALVREGLICELTEHVLEAACRALKHWDARGLQTEVAVNLSVAMLADAALTDRLLTRVKAHGLEPSRVLFEVTETEVAVDMGEALNVMARLRLKGFRLAIDDFGTGYSSLAQLTVVPFSELKIDRSFVRHCEGSARLRDIIESSIGLARRLGLHTVAEGIESEDEWRFLSRAGCDDAQGYFVAKPMASPEILDWAAQRRESIRGAQRA